MRIHSILIAAIALLPLACKKEIKTPPAAEKSNCQGNTWSPDQTYPTPFYSPPLVYNNKVYVFNSSQNNVSIYDGTSWKSKPSRVPFTGAAEWGFVIGNKGYLGRFSYIGEVNFFYEYNFVTGTWLKKADFPGDQRFGPSTFSIGNKGYVVGGFYGALGSSANLHDTWAYNQASNTWTQKASFSPLSGRSGAAGFSINNKGYIVSGRLEVPGLSLYHKTVLEYNPVTNIWSNKAEFPGEGREDSEAFVISGRAYVGGGSSSPTGNLTRYNDYYRYDPLTNSWIKVADAPVSNSSWFGFSINNRGYIVFHPGQIDPFIFFMYKYTPRTCSSPPGPTPN